MTIINYYLLLKTLITENIYKEFFKNGLKEANDLAKTYNTEDLPANLLDARYKILIDMIRTKGILVIYSRFKECHAICKKMLKNNNISKEILEHVPYELFGNIRAPKDIVKDIEANKLSKYELASVGIMSNVLETYSVCLRRYLITFAAAKLRGLYLRLPILVEIGDSLDPEFIKSYVSEKNQDEINEVLGFANMNDEELLYIGSEKNQNKSQGNCKDIINLLLDEIITEIFDKNDVETRKDVVSTIENNLIIIQKYLEYALKCHKKIPEVCGIIKIMLTQLEQIKTTILSIDLKIITNLNIHSLKLSIVGNGQTRLY